MKDIGKRLLILQDHLKFKRSKHFADALNVDNSYFAKAQKGGGIKLEHLEEIINTYNISKYWLLFGEGEIERSGEIVPYKTDVDDREKLKPDKKSELELLRSYITELHKKIISLQEKLIEDKKESDPSSNSVTSAG